MSDSSSSEGDSDDQAGAPGPRKKHDKGGMNTQLLSMYARTPGTKDSAAEDNE